MTYDPFPFDEATRWRIRHAMRLRAIDMSPIYEAVEHKRKWFPIYLGETRIPKVKKKEAS